jgi:hypothetical protein
MIFALNRGFVVSALVMVVVAICFFLLRFGYATSPQELLEWTSKISLIISGLIVLLSIRPVFHVIHAITFAKYWWFPLLDGEWRAEVRSNWPKVERMYLSAKREAAKFDALAAPLTQADELVTLATVNIESSLFDISIEITPVGTSKVSRTRIVRARWTKPDRPELSYVYEQVDHTALAPTDTRQHYGAGIVQFIEKSGDLSGHYWTNRKAEAGLNTAGTIVMRRVQRRTIFERLWRRLAA